ncbi:MAG: hypothetical protein MK213_04260, partial [Planctomycetes bacterium]|nr:hypothetical protein [Planctomycetota bacterium]
MSATGAIVTGCLAPHPPHLVYAANPERNEPKSSGAGAWKALADGYTTLRSRLDALDFDVLIVHTPHWKTRVGHHFLGCSRFEGFSVDPIFPNLFRYHFDLEIDVELSESICSKAGEFGLVTSMMRNPDFRVDYGTVSCCELARPQWDKKLVVLSSAATAYDYSVEAGEKEMLALGEATRQAVEASGQRAVCIKSKRTRRERAAGIPFTLRARCIRAVERQQISWPSRRGSRS